MILPFLSESEIQQVLPFFKEVVLEKGKCLFRPGDDAKGLFFLEKGQVGIQTKTGFEDKQQVVALLSPGAAVGEKGITGQEKRGMTVIAIEDSTLLFLERAHFTKIEESHPHIAIKILKRMLSISSLRLHGCSERLAHVL